MRTAELFYEMQATLGEGPVFDAHSNRLFWTDILGKQLHCYSFRDHQLRTIQAGNHIGAFAIKDEKTLLIAADNGFSFLDLDTETFTFIHDPEAALPLNRFNDGKCDANGRFWAGTMEFSPSSPSGSLYRLDADLEVSKMASELMIANGLAWNKDHTTMYHVDSGRNELYAYDFDLEAGTIGNKRLLRRFEERDGTPDGIAIDRDDCLYIAMWGGSKVIRFNPNSCEIMEEISIPAPHVTSVTFGGEDFKTLYITTARDGLSSEQLDRSPLSGSVFRADVETPGMPLPLFQSNQRSDTP